MKKLLLFAISGGCIALCTSLCRPAADARGNAGAVAELRENAGAVAGARGNAGAALHAGGNGSVSDGSSTPDAKGGWLSLFDGKTLDGWKVGDNAETFTIEKGCIVAHGKTAHLFYEGDVHQHNFKDFDFKAHVMTEPGSNSGIYIHTGYQQGGWPAKGYEVQVNNSHTDWRRTGSLYAVQDVKEVYVKDNEWFWEEVIVKGKHIVIKLNDKVVVDYTEPENVQRPDDMKYRVLSSGTFALQGHDPNSKVWFKDIMVKPLD